MSDIREYLKELSDNYESGDYVDISAYNYFQMAYDEIERLRERIEELEKNAWAWSRGLIGERSYTEEELKQMFGPYVENGDTAGLSPREARLLETLVCTSASLNEKNQRIEELEQILTEAGWKIMESGAPFELEANDET